MPVGEGGRQLAARGAVSVRDDVIEKVVEDINRLQSKATFELVIEMGKLIVDRFYGGDFTLWRRHGPKEASLRKLAARSETDLRVSASSLYRAVALYELSSRLGVSALSGLSMTHIRAVLGLPEDKQARLLEAAHEQRWPSDRLEREARKLRNDTPVRRGRPPSTPLLKAVRRVVVASNDLDAVPDEQVDGLSAEEAGLVADGVGKVSARLTLLGARLAAGRRRLA